MILAALMLAPFMVPLEQRVEDCGSSFTRDECISSQRSRVLICASAETENISDWDLALVIFQNPGESLENAKVDLADERANGCDEGD